MDNDTEARGPGAIFRLISQSGTRTRADLAAATGLGRSAVAQRIDALRALGLVVENGDAESTGGRPAATLRVNASRGLLLAADLGASHARLAVTDLLGDVLAEEEHDLDIGDGPDHVLVWVREQFEAMLTDAARHPDHVWGIGVGLPGPVEFATGRPVHPPIMPGWHGAPVPSFFAESFPDVPVVVDNDVNIMAAGEYWTDWAAEQNLLYVKVATGIGCGIVAGGRIYRGEQGAAGDIGHVHVRGPAEVVCSCGNVFCLEAQASGTAMARQLHDMGLEARSGRDVLRLLARGDAAAARVVRDGGRLIGRVLATLVNFFNPSVILIGGVMAKAENLLLAGIREVVYQRSLPLATRDLTLTTGRLRERAGVVGAAAMTREWVLSAPAIDQRLATAPLDGKARR